MSDRDEDQENCQAFGELFDTIKGLRTIERNAANVNTLALEQCKKEIEMLLCVTGAKDDEAV